MRKNSFSVWAVVTAMILGSTAALPARAQSLEPPMKAMQKDLTALKKEIGDKAQNEASLKALQDMEKNVVAAKGILPPSVQKMTGDEKTKATAEYRTMMLSLLKELVTAEQQVMDGKNDDAVKTIAGLADIETKGHEEFRKDD